MTHRHLTVLDMGKPAQPTITPDSRSSDGRYGAGGGGIIQGLILNIGAQILF